MQIIYIAFGTLATVFAAVVGAGVLPVLNINGYIWVGPYSTILIVVTMVYAIYRYRLLDIVVVIKRTSIYFVMVAIITGLYAFVLMIPQSYVGEPGSPESLAIMILAAIIIALTIEPMRDRLDSLTDRIFFQKKYDYYRVLERISRELNTVFKFEEIINIVNESLLREMHLEKVAIFLREKTGSSSFICYKSAGETGNDFPSQAEEGRPEVDYLLETKAIIEAGELKHQYGHQFDTDLTRAAVYREITETYKVALLVPLVQKKNLIGFMALGAKKSGDLFTSRDIALLETLSSQMATALENVSLYQQMIANERLTIIGTMSAGIAHEIRNPLASIKTFIQMLPDRWDRPDFRQRFTEIVPSEIERLSGITADLLTFSKPSAPSLEIVSMHHTMERIKGLLSSQLRKKQLTLEYDLTSIPSIQVDPQQIFQVFLNLFLNAVYASREKGVVRVTGEVKDQVIGYHFNPGGYLVMTVEDQGIGIKRKDLANIFQPFFTTKTEGTGLGLPTCKRIVEAHHGEIGVESEEGKGTKVTVMLPTNLTQDVIKPFSGFHES